MPPPIPLSLSKLQQVQSPNSSNSTIDAATQNGHGPGQASNNTAKDPLLNQLLDAQGSLNFSGKAVVSARGVQFPSGKSYSISVDDIKVLGEVGRGQFGVVNRVLHIPTGVTMAMKQIKLELTVAACRQILMEMEVLHRANSPYIIEFYGAFFAESNVYLCVELMDAGSLGEILNRSGGIAEVNLGYIALCVTRGLQFLKNTLQVIHRDVKPTNILLNHRGQVKLCDFGVSGQLVHSMANTHIGSQSYMAPERIALLKAAPYTAGADVWSLGMTLWEGAMGYYPFQQHAYDSVFAQLSAIVNEMPPELSHTFSDECRQFVAVCLTRDPVKRPNYDQLLTLPFLTNMAKNVDDTQFMEQIFQWIQKYGNPLPQTALA